VLKVDRVHVIRHKVRVEGLSARQVSREMGVSRNTVRKYLVESEPVRGAESRPRGRPVYEVVVGRLEELFEEWSSRTTRKQRMTARRLHRELVSEGYQVGLTVVQDWLREKRRAGAEVYVPLVHHPGDEAQVDFFEVVVEVAGAWVRAWLFVMRLMFSGRDFGWLYERADQVSFLDGHVRAFEHFGSVPHRCVYDNLGSAVRRMVSRERQLTGRFAALVSHYLFEPCFTRPGTGHDKGGVEGRGKGIRWQHLTPIPRGEDLEAIASQLLLELDARAVERGDREGRSVLERFEEERLRMLPLPEVGFRAERVVLVEASRRALVGVEGAWYSVPTSWHSLEVTAYVGPREVRLECRGESVSHRRQSFGSRSVRYRHYLSELARKPQALRQVAAELLGELGEPYGRLWRMLVDAHGPREAARVFARVLGAVCDHGEEAVAEAIGTALAAHRHDLLALAEALQTRSLSNPVPATLAEHHIESASVADYDRLLLGEEGR
jgi:transposase